MPAAVTLATTMLMSGINDDTRDICVASAAGLAPGTRLFIDRELFSVVSVGVTTSMATCLVCQRGVDGTSAVPHAPGATVTIGNASQFYGTDPVGVPPIGIPVSPYINVKNGTVWFAQGDALDGATRWWQQQTTTYGVGALGLRTVTLDPTEST